MSGAHTRPNYTQPTQQAVTAELSDFAAGKVSAVLVKMFLSQLCTTGAYHTNFENCASALQHTMNMESCSILLKNITTCHSSSEGAYRP
jgi:hypothetical protein